MAIEPAVIAARALLWLIAITLATIFPPSLFVNIFKHSLYSFTYI